MSHAQLISDLAEVDAVWLTELLRATAALQDGSVARIESAGENCTHAATERLLIQYSPDANGALPRTLFLNICLTESAALFGRTELDL